MQVVSIPSPFTYTNLYTLSGFDAGTSLIVTNNTSSPAYIVQASLPPLADSDQYPLLSGQTVLVHAKSDPVWIRGGSGPVLVQSVTETITPFTGVDLPHDIYTSPMELYRRVKVDPGQTSFHDGREFRTFYEFSIAAAASVYIQANVAIDTILYDVSCVCDAGGIRLSTYAGSTGTGTYATPLPILPKNTMTLRSTPFYTAQNTLFTGGTGVTGGVVIDRVRVVAANATAQQSSVGSKSFDQRGVGAGTYYWRLENFGSGTATGVFSGWWAELVNLGAG